MWDAQGSITNNNISTDHRLKYWRATNRYISDY